VNQRKQFLLTAVITMLGALSMSAQAQESHGSKTGLSASDFYNRIIELKFPLPAESPKWGKVMVVLRFTPSSGSESQINIIQNWNDDGFKVIEYYLPSGSKSISEQLSQLHDESKLDTQDPAEVAMRIQVKVRTISVPSSALYELIKQLDHLPFPSMEIEQIAREMMFDGPTYELWYKAFLLGEVHFRYNYASTHNENAKGLADWMDRVKKVVDSAK
jgi:hypothetical protein